MKPLLSINRYFARYKWYLIGGILFTAISNVFAILPAQIVRYSFELVQKTIDLYFLFGGLPMQQKVVGVFAASILVYGILIVAMALLRGVFLFLMRQTLIVMSRHIEYDQKNDIYAHYQTLPTAFYRRNNTGDLMARVSEDVSRVRMYTGPAIMYAINLLVLFVMVIGYMLSVNVRLTLYTLAPLPILSVTIYFVNTLINKKSEAIQRQLSTLSTYVQEAFSGIRVLKAFAREDSSAAAFAVESDVYRTRSLELANVQALFFPVMLGMVGLSTIITVYVGGLEVQAGHISTGTIAEFIIYVNMLTWPVTSLGWITSLAQRASASQERINQFLDEKTNIVSAENLTTPVQGSIVFEDVAFAYPDGRGTVLEHLNFQVQPGESLAVLGRTGSGKSTLAALIGRMYDATEGRVLVDGRPIQTYKPEHLRSQMAFVPQEVFLFSDTIQANIAFGNPSVGLERIREAAADADLLSNVEGFSAGFDTVVGERGVTLSGGQKQRVSIARALVLDPRVLVLDDCLSAVDTTTENTILQNLQRIMVGRTTVIISHRVSSAKLANKIIVLDGGTIAEAGSHAELLARGGLYAEMYDRQMAGEEV